MNNEKISLSRYRLEKAKQALKNAIPASSKEMVSICVPNPSRDDLLTTLKVERFGEDALVSNFQIF